MKKRVTTHLVRLLLILVMIPCAAPAYADIVFLRNQRYYKGKVIGQTIDSIEFRTRDGLRIQISKKKIRKILYINDSKQAELDREAKKRREEWKRREAAAARKRARDAREAAAKRKLEEKVRRRREVKRLVELRKKAVRRAASESKTRKEKRLGGLWRSALLPGWGQYYQNRKKRATTFFAGFAGGSVATFYFASRYRAFRDDHDFAITRTILQTPLIGSSDVFLLARNIADAGGTRRRMERGSRRANTVFTLLIGLYAWNLVDVYFFDLSDDSYVSIQTRGEGLAFGFHTRY